MTTTAGQGALDFSHREVRLYEDDGGGLSLWVPGSLLAWGGAEMSGSCLDRDAVSLLERDKPGWSAHFLGLNFEYRVGGEDDVRGDYVMRYELCDDRCGSCGVYFVRHPPKAWQTYGPVSYQAQLIARYFMGEMPRRP